MRIASKIVDFVVFTTKKEKDERIFVSDEEIGALSGN